MSLSSMMERNKHTESTEIEKWPKKENRDFLRTGKEMLLVDSKVSSSQNQVNIMQSISVVFEHCLHEEIP